MFSSLRSLGGLLLITGLAQQAVAQTFTECNPMESDDCPIRPALSMEYPFDWTEASNSTTWDASGGGSGVKFEKDSAKFTIAKQLDSPTLTSSWFIHFGRVEVHMKAARGQGIVSSIVIQSDNLDEIDWELVGGVDNEVQSNYFGKGVTEPFNRGGKHPVIGAMDRFVNYTIEWNHEAIEFWVDGTMVRNLPKAEATHEIGDIFPQTPSFVRIGVWAGGDPENNKKGVVEWAGGETDFSKAPFTMEVKDVIIKDYGTPDTKEYEYGDRSGSWESIIAHPGNSTQKEALLAGPEEKKKSVSEKFNALPDGSKIAVYASCGGVGLILICAFAFVCFKKRRQGKREAAAYRAKQEAMDEDHLKYQTELKAKGISPDALGGSGMDPKSYGGAVVTTAATRGDSFGSGTTRPALYHDVSQTSLRSPTSPGFGNNQYNNAFNPRSPSPGGDSGGAYTEFYQPQPRANTNGTWNNAPSPNLNRQDSDSSTWGPSRPEHISYNGTYGRVPDNASQDRF